jgi:mannose-6-phosphate isomerase
MQRQFKYQCCGTVVNEYVNNETQCRFCGKPSPILEEVDKDEAVVLFPPRAGHSGDALEEIRNWGSFRVVMDEPNVKVKKIIVNPNSRLSLQLHRYRAEWWKIVEGSGLMQLGTEEFEVSKGDTVSIAKLQVHRVANNTNMPLVFVEIQSGECMEDDIIRIEDDYGRA